MKILHHIQLYSKSNLEIPHINVLCGVKRCYKANHIAYKCVCEIINSAAKMCQIENGTQMAFRTVHYLDCLLRTQLWKYSVRALMSHVLYGQQQLSAVALRTTDAAVQPRDSAAACSVTSMDVLFLNVACSLKNLHS